MTSYLRYKQQIRTVQDADDAEIESWITVRGNHIPIRKGQSKEEAVKSFVESKGQSTGAKSEPKSNKQVFYKNISGKQIGSPKGRTFIENEIMTEKEMAKHGFDPTDKRFERKELGKNEHHFFFGARFENTKEPESSNKDVKNTFLSNPNTLKEFASHFGMSEKAVKNASEKFGDAFYHLTTKDPQAGVGIATNYEKYTKEDVEKHLEGLNQKTKESKPESSKKDTGDLRSKFSQKYDELYKDSKKDAKYNYLVKDFDLRMKDDPQFKKQVQEFVKERGDVLSSDREVKAYMLARNEANKTSASKTESKESKPESSKKWSNNWKKKENNIADTFKKYTSTSINNNKEWGKNYDKLKKDLRKEYKVEKSEVWNAKREGITFGASSYGERGTNTTLTISKNLKDLVLSLPEDKQQKLIDFIEIDEQQFSRENIDRYDFVKALKNSTEKNGKVKIQIETTTHNFMDN